MNQVITSALFSLYGDGFLQSFYDVMRVVMDAASDVLNADFIRSIFSAFSGVTASLIILFFFIELFTSITNQMLTMEKLMMMVVRFVGCFAICLLMPQLCDLLVQFGSAFLGFMNNSMSNWLNSINMVVFIPYDQDEFLERMNDVLWLGAPHYSLKDGAIKQGISVVKQIGFFLAHPIWSIEAFIIEAIAGIMKLVGYFVGVSTAITLIVQVFLAPIGAVNFFRGENSSGMNYIKSLLATVCSFAAMLGVVAAASLLTQGLIKNNIFEALDFSEDGIYSDTLTEDVEPYKENQKGEVTKYIGTKTGSVFGADSDLLNDDKTSATYDVLLTIDLSDETLKEFAEYEMETDSHGIVYKIFHPLKYIGTESSRLENYEDQVVADEIDLALNFRVIITALIPQLAAIGGMAGASRIIHDAFGVRGGGNGRG